MEENRKGPGVFYAVVGVATLVVAIIGATFAFFSASATNNTDVAGTTAEAADMTLTVTPVTVLTPAQGEDAAVTTGTNMIPMLPVDLQRGLTGENQGENNTPTSCVDLNGNNVCMVYRIDITSSSTADVVVNGSMILTANKGEEPNANSNLKWQLLTDATTADALATTHGVDEDALTGTFANNLTLSSTIGTQSFYVVVWLNDTGAAQELVDAGNSYVGTVTFDAAGTGITASFTGHA